MKTSNQEVVVETTQTETETLAFQVASRDLGPFIVDAGGHHPDPLSPLAPDLESYAPGSIRPSSDLEAVLAHPRARDVASVVACPSLKLWGRTGGGTVPVSSFAVCGRPAIHPDLFVVVSPSFEDAFVLEVLEGIEEVAAWWADTLASPVEDDRPNLLPPPIALETLVYAFHTIDAFRRATLEGMLAYTTTEQPAISADEFSDSLLRAIGSRDLRWLLPAFLHLVPGLDVAGIDPRSEHLLFLVNQSFFVPAAEREDDRDVLVFGEAGIALGAEFHHGWLSAAGFELLVRSTDGTTCLERGFLAPTAFTNHMVLVGAEHGAPVNHQAMTLRRLMAKVVELVELAVEKAQEPIAAKPPSPPVESKAPVLIGQTGPHEGARIVLDVKTTLGRSADNVVVLEDKTASGHHAVLLWEADRLRVEDLGSTNGTSVNGVRVTGSAELADGDVLLFGGTRFVIELPLGESVRVYR